VLRESTPAGERLRMLDTLRDYAAGKLQAAPDAPAVRARHCEHFFALSKDGSRGLQGADQPKWLRRFEAETDNLRAARALAVAGGVDPVLAAKLTVNLLGFWLLRGRASEGRAAVAEALALPAVQASDLAHAWVLYAGAGLAGAQGAHAEARRLLEQCLAIRRGLGNPIQIAATLSTLALTRLQTGDAAGAAQDEQEALALFRDHGDQVGEAIARLHLGQIALQAGDDATATAEFEAAGTLAHAIGHHEVEGESQLMRGQLAWLAGDLDRAAARFDAALAICRAAEDKRGEADALHWLGKADLDAGRLDQARQRLGEALRAFRDFEMAEGTVDCLEDHAAWLAAAGDSNRAVELAAAAAQARTRLALPRPPRLEPRWLDVLGALRRTVGEEPHAAAWQRGRRMETNEAAEAALAALRIDAPDSRGPGQAR
jgi:tetratricopeptide (TPR) repeat protein